MLAALLLLALAPAASALQAASGVGSVGSVFVASCVGSLVQKLALYPLDTLKTRAQHERGPRRPAAVARQPADASGRLRRALSLYRGITPALLGVVPVSLVYMPVYELCKGAALRLPPGRQGLGKLLSGSMAGLACSAVQVPTTVLKNRMQVSQYATLPEALRRVWADEGLPGFYAGWALAALLDVLYATVQFVCLEWLRGLAQGLAGARALRPWENALVGFATGAFTAFCTEPLDVVKTRLMTQGRREGKREGADGRAKGGPYRGAGDAIVRIARDEGLLALWRGLGPRMAYVACKSAVWYGTYETTRALLAPAAPAPVSGAGGAALGQARS